MKKPVSIEVFPRPGVIKFRNIRSAKKYTLIFRARKYDGGQKWAGFVHNMSGKHLMNTTYCDSLFVAMVEINKLITYLDTNENAKEYVKTIKDRTTNLHPFSIESASGKVSYPGIVRKRRKFGEEYFDHTPRNRKNYP